MNAYGITDRDGELIGRGDAVVVPTMQAASSTTPSAKRTSTVDSPSAWLGVPGWTASTTPRPASGSIITVVA